MTGPVGIPAASPVFPAMRPFHWLRFTAAHFAAAAAAHAAVHINEFMAANPGRPQDPDALLDMDGNSPGWIELHNDSDAEVPLTGWALSDDPAQPGKWVFAAPIAPATQPTTVPARGYRIVFCGGLPRNIANVEPHTDFKIDDSGVLLLSQPDGQGRWKVVSQVGSVEAPYPNQRRAASFGFPGDDPSRPPVFFETDSPGAANAGSGGVPGFCADPDVSVARGFFESPFPLVITSATPGATLSVTTNGELPSPTTGTQFKAADEASPPTATLDISGTTLVRVRAWKPGLGASHAKTHTYLFAADVLRQSGPLPSMGLKDADTFNWGAAGGDLRSPAGPDWAVDPEIVNHPIAENRFTVEDLRKLPVVSVITGWVEAFGPKSTAATPLPVDRRGFYVGAAVGVANEGADRAASLELINPDGDVSNPNGSRGFQVDGNVHVFGGTSQNRWKSYKLSMRFKADEVVHQRLYGDDASPDQNLFILDARLNQAWVHPDATQRSRGDYVRDHVMADLQNRLGGATFHSRPVHCFLNGLYWGLYILHEKPDERFMAAYLGGDPGDWDVFKHSGGNGVDGGTLFDNVINAAPINAAYPLGSRTDAAAAPYFNATALQHYEELLDTLGIGRVAPNPVPSLALRESYEAVAGRLDIPAFIDYMLLNFVAANSDWAHKNFYASYHRTGPHPRWRFHSWDAEHVFRTESENSVGKNDAYGPTAIHQKLMANAEYRLAFADAIQRHLFNAGVLSTTGLRAAFNHRFAEIEPAGVRGESARWGDNRNDSVPYTYLGAWTAEKKRLLDVVCVGRGSTAATPATTALNQMKAVGLYPATAAPELRDNSTDKPRHGGPVPAGFALKIANPGAGGGTIYFTLDGTDPRVAWSGEVAASAREYSTASVLGASATVKARVRSGTNWSALTEAYFSVGTQPAGPENLVVSEFHYRPASPNAAELAAGFDQRSRFEFVELMNIGPAPVNLLGVRIGAGLDYTFDVSSSVRELAPGAVVLVVADRAAFEARYGKALPVAGTFQLGSNLADGGERLQILAADGTAVADVTYNDRAPWPEAADGDGYSLTLIQPFARPDPSLPSSWRPSASIHGSPGASDVLALGAWKSSHDLVDDTSDPDGDGWVSIFEYALGRNPRSAESQAAFTVALEPRGDAGTFMAVALVRDPRADEVRVTPEFSDDLESWAVGAERAEVLPRPDGLQTEIWRSLKPVGAAGHVFARLRLDFR